MYLMPKARNTTTGQTVKAQDLTGAKLTNFQAAIAQDLAEQLAAKMSARTGDRWVPVVESYTPRQRRSD